MVQMHQKDKMGGGYSETARYLTWEIKECPECGDTYLERYYTALVWYEEFEVNSIKTPMIMIHPEDKKHPDYYTNQLYKPKHVWSDDLGYIHYEELNGENNRNK